MGNFAYLKNSSKSILQLLTLSAIHLKINCKNFIIGRAVGFRASLDQKQDRVREGRKSKIKN